MRIHFQYPWNRIEIYTRRFAFYLSLGAKSYTNDGLEWRFYLGFGIPKEYEYHPWHFDRTWRFVGMREIKCRFGSLENFNY